MWTVANFLLVRPRSCYFRHIHPPYKETQPFFFSCIFFFLKPSLSRANNRALSKYLFRSYLLCSMNFVPIVHNFLTWPPASVQPTQGNMSSLWTWSDSIHSVHSFCFRFHLILFQLHFSLFPDFLTFFLFGSLYTYFSRQPQNHFRMSLEQTIKSS